MIKIIKKMLLVLIITLIMPICVNAKENYSIDVTTTGIGTESSSISFKLNGFNFHEGGYPEYYAYICNDEDPKPELSEVDNSTFKVKGDVSNKWHKVDSRDGYIGLSEDWYMYGGYTSAYILKKNSSSKTDFEISDRIQIEKPEKFPKEKGYKYYFSDKNHDNGSVFSNDLSVFFKYPGASSTEHDFIFKFGVVTDNTILNKYIKNSPDAYDSLISYAKNSDGTKILFNTSNCTGVDISSYNISLNNGSYYYIYIYTEENGLRDLSDVYIKKAEMNTLHDLTREDGAADNVSYSEKQTVKNPKTDDANIYILFIFIVLFGILTIYAIKRLKKK